MTTPPLLVTLPLRALVPANIPPSKLNGKSARNTPPSNRVKPVVCTHPWAKSNVPLSVSTTPVLLNVSANVEVPVPPDLRNSPTL